MEITDNKSISLVGKDKDKPKYSLLESLKSLRKNPRDFWLLYLLEVVEFTSFCITCIVLTIYNTKILNFSDKESGTFIGLIGLFVGVFSIILSSIPARYGIKCSFIVLAVLGIGCNALMLLNPAWYICVAVIYGLFVPSAVLLFVTLKLGIKLLSYPSNRSLAYSMFYTVLYISGVIGSVITDIVLSAYNKELPGFRLLFFINIGVYAAGLGISALVRDISIEETGIINVELLKESESKYLKETLSTKQFWRFFILVMLLTVIKSIYTHLSITLPIYMYRSIGEDSHFSYFMILHLLVLLVFTPLLTSLIRDFDHYTLLEIGSCASSLSSAVFLYGSNYYTIGLFVVYLSIGEAIYAPRLVDYTLQIAPKGKEAIYLGVANFTNAFSIAITGVSSGLLLSSFCPETGPKNCSLVWLSIGLYSIIPSLIILLGRKFFEGENNLRSNGKKV